MRRGFTLIELMVVVAVIAILAMISLFGIGLARAAARNTQRQQIMNGIRGALQRYYSSNNRYYNVASFHSMLNALWIANFISPVTDPGCGGGAINFNYTMGNTFWQPCVTSTEPSYYYESPGDNGGPCTGTFGSAYQLRLVKEGGGTNYFCSPQ